MVRTKLVCSACLLNKRIKSTLVDNLISMQMIASIVLLLKLYDLANKRNYRINISESEEAKGKRKVTVDLFFF